MNNKSYYLYNESNIESGHDFFDVHDRIARLIVEMIKRRISLHLSQRDLANISGIKQPMIARIEKMETIPRIDTVIILAKSLGMKISLYKDDHNNNIII